jgi:hypothetical protein
MSKKRNNHRFIYLVVVFLVVLVVLSFVGVFVGDIAGEAYRKYRGSSKRPVLTKSDSLLDKDFKLLRNHIISSENNRFKLILDKGIKIIPNTKEKDLTRYLTKPLRSLKKSHEIPKRLEPVKEHVFILSGVIFPFEASFSEPVPVIFELTDKEIDEIGKMLISAIGKITYPMRIALISNNGKFLQFIPFDLEDFFQTKQLKVWVTHTYFKSIVIVSPDPEVGIWVEDFIISDDQYTFKSQFKFSSLPSICIWDSPKMKCDIDGMIGQSCCAKECGSDFTCDGKQPGDNCGYTPEGMSKHCDPNCGCIVDTKAESTCSDNKKNQDETGIDCGGPCAPCNSKCKTGTIYSPSDSGCEEAWPIPGGYGNYDENQMIIGNYEFGHKCEVMEICSPELDYIIQEASDCCSGKVTDKFKSFKEGGCEWAKEEADKFDGSNKACRSLYILKYITGETFEKKYKRFPPIPYMSCTSGLTDGEVEAQFPDYMGECGPKSFLSHKVKNIPECSKLPCNDPFANKNNCFEGLGWESDTDMSQNNCFPTIGPTHAVVNIMEAGMCIQSSLSILTLLRKAGFSEDEVFVAEGHGHAFLLLKIPGDDKFHAIETSSNLFGYKFHDHLDPPPDFSYCNHMKKYYNDKVMVGILGDNIYLPFPYDIYGCEEIETQIIS